MRTFVFLIAIGMGVPAAAQDGAALYTQHCASCHDAATRAPSRQVLGLLSADRIVASLATGLMRQQGEALSAEQRLAIARHLSAAPAATTTAAAAPRCDASVKPSATPRDWTAWGVTLANDRFQRTPGFSAAQTANLKLKWAFGFEGEANAAANPTIAGDRVYVGSGSGRVYSLGLRDGCLAWMFKADGGVRAAVVVGHVKPGEPPTAFVSDIRATVYALDATSGELKWTRRLETHPAARITGSPVLYNGRLFVPLASVEEATGGQATYECCKFRGSLIAVDASTGADVWQTYTIREKPTPQGKNARGTTLYGPSGAALWSAPTIDPQTNSIYIATGDSYSTPAAPTSDAVMALDIATGAIKWVNQATAGDAFTMACLTADKSNCPETPGPDHDFGQSPILLPLSGGRRVLVAGQKSGEVHAFDPDAQGKKLWTRPIGKGGLLGGIEWGSASDGTHMFVPLSDVSFKEPAAGRALGAMDSQAGGGLFALRLADGSVAWTGRASACGAERAQCSPALSAPAAAIPGAVFAGSLDGHFRAYSTTDGKVLWDFDTARDFQTVNGVAARGGSIDVGGPAIANGTVVTTSGYAQWGGMRGNVLLAFSVDGR